MAKKKGDNIEVSEQERKELLQPQNVSLFASKHKGLFSDMILTIDLLQAHTMVLETIDDALPAAKQLELLLAGLRMEFDPWLVAVKRYIGSNPEIAGVTTQAQLFSLLKKKGKISLRRYMALALKEQTALIKPGVNYLLGIINDKINKLKAQAEKMKA